MPALFRPGAATLLTHTCASLSRFPLNPLTSELPTPFLGFFLFYPLASLQGAELLLLRLPPRGLVCISGAGTGQAGPAG